MRVVMNKRKWIEFIVLNLIRNFNVMLLKFGIIDVVFGWY